MACHPRLVGDRLYEITPSVLTEGFFDAYGVLSMVYLVQQRIL